MQLVMIRQGSKINKLAAFWEHGGFTLGLMELGGSRMGPKGDRRLQT